MLFCLTCDCISFIHSGITPLSLFSPFLLLGTLMVSWIIRESTECWQLILHPVPYYTSLQMSLGHRKMDEAKKSTSQMTSFEFLHSNYCQHQDLRFMKLHHQHSNLAENKDQTIHLHCSSLNLYKKKYIKSYTGTLLFWTAPYAWIISEQKYSKLNQNHKNYSG